MKRLTIILIFLLFANPIYAEEPNPYQRIMAKINDKSQKRYTIERIVDNNTIKLADGTIVELIGIVDAGSNIDMYTDKTGKDKKEINQILQEVKEFLKWAEGQEVLLEYAADKGGREGQSFSYVWLPKCTFHTDLWKYECGLEDSKNMPVLLNAAIIFHGYGFYIPKEQNLEYHNMFVNLNLKAEEYEFGVWKSEVKNQYTIMAEQLNMMLQNNPSPRKKRRSIFDLFRKE